MKKLQLIFASIILTASLAVGLVALSPSPNVALADCGSAIQCAQKGVNSSGGDSTSLSDYIKTIINILLFIIGIIAVIVIVIAGIQYVTSGGNADQASKAKNAIIYAVVGIIIAVMAYAIVGFVVGNI